MVLFYVLCEGNVLGLAIVILVRFRRENQRNTSFAKHINPDSFEYIGF